MPWQAKPGCADHHRPVVERVVNKFPPAWLLPPESGEVFDSLDHCERRMRSFPLLKGSTLSTKVEGQRRTLVGAFAVYFMGRRHETIVSSKIGWKGVSTVLLLVRVSANTPMFVSSAVNGKDSVPLRASEREVVE